jgi:hypothetical protein
MPKRFQFLARDWQDCGAGPDKSLSRNWLVRSENWPEMAKNYAAPQQKALF